MIHVALMRLAAGSCDLPTSEVTMTARAHEHRQPDHDPPAGPEPTATAAALARLAALDSRPPLAGPVLGAEVDGELLAAISRRRRRAGRGPVPRTSELAPCCAARRSVSSGDARAAAVAGGCGVSRPAPQPRARPALGGSPAGRRSSGAAAARAERARSVALERRHRQARVASCSQ